MADAVDTTDVADIEDVGCVILFSFNSLPLIFLVCSQRKIKRNS